MGSVNSDVLVVGAGMAGLTCAARLADAGRSVVVIDKGRGPGGRMAARRTEIAGATVTFDHGAQYFTARAPAFRAQVAAWEAKGVVARWPAAGEDAWVGVPGMNAPIRAMSETLDLHWNTRAERLIHDGTHWCAITGDARYCAETLLIAIPAEQASALLHEAAPDLSAVADAVTSQPCWAVMAAFAEPVALAVDAVRNADAAVAWAARNSAKPGRSGTECWVLHASPARSHELIELSAPEVGTILLADFFAQTGTAPVEPIHLAAHRWLYAMPPAGGVAGEAARYDAIHRIGIAGDYLHSPGVEGAFVSGNLLAQAVLAAA